MSDPAAHRLRTRKTRDRLRHLRLLRRVAPGMTAWQLRIVREVVSAQHGTSPRPRPPR